MSEVKLRINWNMQEFYPDTDGQYVLASDYDAALAREAALREELESFKDRRFAARLEKDELRKRLTIAEQRNAELVELLQECVNVVRFGEDFDLPITTMARIDALLTNSTESGASE
ncbi:hypothetical protein ACVBEG_02910 [Pseudomonas sp. GG8]